VSELNLEWVGQTSSNILLRFVDRSSVEPAWVSRYPQFSPSTDSGQVAHFTVFMPLMPFSQQCQCTERESLSLCVRYWTDSELDEANPRAAKSDK